MATTTNGIYYPNDYDSVADIPADMKKIAESVDTKISENKTEINNIKTEQTTQNTNISNLQKDNTTNKQDITNIKAKDTEQDKYIAELEAENARLREDLNGLPKGQASGESKDLNDSAEMRCELKISGNSTQETTTGKNLLPNNATTQTYFGITITKKDDGTLILNGTATDNIQLNLLNNKRDNTMLPEADIKYSLESGIYKLSGCTNGSSSTYKLDVWVYGAEGLKATCFNQEVQFTLDEEKIVSYLRLVVYSGATLNNVVIKPMVRLASVTDDTYEPYTGGIASPNPNYEQPIKNCGDNANLCDGINQEYWLNTTTLIAGKLSGNTGLIIPVDGVSKYTISTKIVQTRYRVACIDTEISSDGSETAYNGQSQDNTNNSITIDTTGHNYLLVNATSLENIKIEKGTKATPYSPYGMGSINEKIKNADGTEEQDYSIFVQQPMRSIGDVRDCFVKKSDGWYERHYIARLVLKGNGFWSYNAGVGFHSSSLQGIVKNSSEALSNKYKYTPLTWQGNYTFSINSTGLIAISDNTYSTVDDWKAHLAEQYANGTPVYVDYVLEEPLDIECTEEQSTILFDIEQNAKTYKGVTHMYSTDNVSPVIDVTYKKDIETLFANTLVEGV